MPVTPAKMPFSEEGAMKAVRSLLLMLVVVTLGGCWWGPGPGYDHGGYGQGGYDHGADGHGGYGRGGDGHGGYDRGGGPGRER